MAGIWESIRRGGIRIVKIGIGLALVFGLAIAVDEFVPGVSIRLAIPSIGLVVAIISIVLRPQIPAELRKALTELRTGPEETVGARVADADLGPSLPRRVDVPDPADDPLGTIESQGFDRLTDDEFQHGTVERETCWRREFTFTEVAEGIPIDRHRSREGHPSVTEELLDDLADGGAVRLTGDPGAGKTTTTRMVAHRWHEQDGTVLYRQQQSDPITHPRKLERAIRQFTDDGPVLVIVEDVARHGTVRFLETLHGLETDPEVSVLINAREREWENLGDLAAHHEEFDRTAKRDQDVLDVRYRYPEQRKMPPLHTDDIGLLIEHFERETDHTVSADAEQLESMIETTHGVSPMLLLSYHLPVRGVTAEMEGHETALHANVAETYRRINGPDFDDQLLGAVGDVETLRQVALLVNVMNAAELPLHPVFFISVGDPEEEAESVKAAVDALDALLFFGEDESGLKQSHHPVWSELYLRQLLEEEDDARQQFETVVNALFEFTAKLERQGNVEEGHVDWFVDSIFGIGPAHPPLAPLFSTSEESGIEVPDACSASIKANCALYRHQMYRTLGEDEAVEELQEAERRFEEARYGGVLSGPVLWLWDRVRSQEPRFRAVLFNERGNRAKARGDYEQAREFHQQSLAIKRDLDDRAGEAGSLNNLGLVARHQGDYEQAREHHQQSLAIKRNLDDRAGEATSLNNLGLVAEAQGDYEQAREFHQQSLAIKRDLGDRAGEANSLGNLGLVADAQGDYEQAREHHQQSLAIKRDLGDRNGEAGSLNNLGEVARHQGDYEQAREYYQQSLAIFRDLGDRNGEATSLGNLGAVAQRQGDYEQAREYYQQSLAIKRDLGDRAGEANSLNNLGAVAGEQGDHETAKERFEEAAELFAKLGTVRKLLNGLENLARAHENLGNQDEAIQTCERALSVIEESDITGIESEAQRFEQLRLRLDESVEKTRPLYHLALMNVLRNEGHDAMQSLKSAWDRREQVEPDDDLYPVVLAAGVGYAAHTVPIDDEDVTADRRETLAAIETHRDRLSEPARVLYDYLAGDDPGTTPEDLRDSVEVDSEDVDPDDLDLDELETLAYAVLLEFVQSRETDSEPVEVE